MKKLLTFLLLITALTSSAQVYQSDPSYGRSIDRYQVLKALHIPTTSGVPNLDNDVITNTSAIAYDSTGHKFYVYDPSTETWGQVTGGGVVVDPGVDSITYHNNQLCQWVSGVSTCYFLNKFYDSTALNFDSTRILHFNSGNLVDSVLIPTGTIHIIQDGAGETNIVRVEDSTRMHFATLKNTDDITISKASDSAVLLQFTHPHYTKDQVDSIAAGITSEGITRAELIDTADNKVNKTDISGGTINQVLKKNSSTDYDWSWQDESGGVAQSVISDTLKNYASYGSITTPNVLFSTPLSLSVSDHQLTGTLALNSQSAYTGFGNWTGSSAVPAFGKIPVQAFSATGTPSTSTYLRGDGVWATPSGGSGSGTVNWFNIVDSGADKTGVIDATTSIQKAINGAHVKGGTVYVPSGTYVSHTLTWYNNVKIIGDGMGSIIKSISAEPLIQCLNTFLDSAYSYPTNSISDITLDGNSIGTIGINLKNIALFKFSNLRIRNFTSIGAKLKGVLIGTFQDSWFSFNPTSVYADSSSYADPKLCSFYDCQFQDSRNRAIDWNRGSRAQFYSCDFERCGSGTDSTTGAIFVANMGMSKQNVGLVLNGCWFEQDSGIAINISSPFVVCNSSIINSAIVNNGIVADIKITSGSAANNLNIFGGQVGKIIADGSLVNVDYNNCTVASFIKRNSSVSTTPIKYKNGQANLAGYGSGTFTGTAAQILSVDASGNIIEGAFDFGMSPTWSGTHTFTNSTAIVNSANNTTGLNAQFGTFGIQSYGINNGWLSDNLYFNSGFKYKTNGYGALAYFNSGTIAFAVAPNGTTGATVTPINAVVINRSGDVGFGNISSVTALTGAKAIIKNDGSATFTGMAKSYVAKSANYTATITDYTIDCTGGGTFTITLPTAVGITGREYVITNSGTGTITITTTSSQTFTNVTAIPTTLTITSYGAYTVQATASGNWVVVNKL